jgi:NAD(P)-dependent dehydrogenase (short-subunit alcohol dehydrogenase family)
LAATRGYAVAVNYRSNAQAADAVVQQIQRAGGRAAAFKADVAREDEVRSLFDGAEARLGSITALVNSAGILGPYGHLDEAAPDGLRRVLDTNVLGTLLCCREALRRLSTRHGGPGGAIVNLSSIASVLGSPSEFVAYAASKGAVDGRSSGLART